MVRALFRVAFMIAIFGGLSFLHFNPTLLGAVADGTASPLALVVWGLTTPAFLGFVGLVGVVAFLLPFLPDRDPYGD
jgi:hypothetical protein